MQPSVDVAVAITDTANLHSGAPAGFHIGSRIADHQAVLRIGFEDIKGLENYVRIRFAGKSIGALHMGEVRQ